MSGAAGCGLVKALEKGDEPPMGSTFGAMALVLLPLLVLAVMRMRAPEQRRKYEQRPHKCDQCVQAFTRLHDLKRHKRIHLEVKVRKAANPLLTDSALPLWMVSEAVRTA